MENGPNDALLPQGLARPSIVDVKRPLNKNSSATLKLSLAPWKKYNIFDCQRAELGTKTTLSERRQMLQQLWASILHHEEELIQALAEDLGKPRESSLA